MKNIIDLKDHNFMTVRKTNLFERVFLFQPLYVAISFETYEEAYNDYSKNKNSAIYEICLVDSKDSFFTTIKK